MWDASAGSAHFHGVNKCPPQPVLSHRFVRAAEFGWGEILTVASLRLFLETTLRPLRRAPFFPPGEKGRGIDLAGLWHPQRMNALLLGPGANY